MGCIVSNKKDPNEINDPESDPKYEYSKINQSTKSERSPSKNSEHGPALESPVVGIPALTEMSKPAKQAHAKTQLISTTPNSNLNRDCKCTTKGNYQILPPPIQSASDKKQYKVIRLENGLTACLIADTTPIESEESSDEDDYNSISEKSFVESESDGEEDELKVEQKMAAAALTVGVGSFSDPKRVPGMAHFLEHMVFMGSKKFPEENDFDAFIKKGGGSDNASTDAETTCFYFECLEKNLYTGLDKFAQFFISPLMKKNAMQREREAIESEFQIALPSDSSRKEQLLCSFAKTDSPVNTFTWGNLITLKDNIGDGELYEGVHKFRERHYSANRMTLAIQARMSLDTLGEYVLDCFTDVPNNKLLADDFSEQGKNVFDTPSFKRLYYIKPTKDQCKLELTWALPSLLDKYKSKPQHYVSYLLGDEGKGSLLSYLKKKVWVLGNSTGNNETGMEHNSMYSLFTVTMVLTDEGLKHLPEVIEAVFAYINMLKQIGPQERIFNEIKIIADTSFKFATEEAAVDLVEDLSESMQFYPSEDYIAGSELFYNYDPEGIKMVTNCLVPEKMNIMLFTKDLPKSMSFDKKETWFGTEYHDMEIPADWIKSWQEVAPYRELSIPPPNQYLTTDFSILPEVEDLPDYPTKVVENNLYELWYRKDDKFDLPTARYHFYLISPLSLESSTNLCLLELLFNHLVIDITEELYPASSADLNYQFASGDKGLMLKVDGYNEKLPVLIEVISKYLKTIGDRITEEMFNAIKDKLIKSYYNKLLKPASLGKDLRLHLLVSNYWTPCERYAVLPEITFNMMKQFCVEYFKTLYVKCLVQGNVTEEIAKSTTEKFIKHLQHEPLLKEHYPKFRVIQLPSGEACCRVQGFNKNDSNSIVTNYYQAGPFNLRNSVIIEIIMMIIEEPLFDTLRTKEQLGYHVFSSIRDTFGILGYTITVNSQATKFTTHHVDNRIEEFIKHANELLKNTSEKEFEQTKADLIKMKQCSDVHLKEEVERNWSEIVSDDYVFDRLKKEITAVGDIRLDEIQKWWNDHNKIGNKEAFRKLTIQVVGYNTKEKKDKEEVEGTGDNGACSAGLKFIGKLENSDEEAKPDKYFIQNVESFKEHLYIYPVVQRV